MRLFARFRLNQKKKLVVAGFEISNHKWVQTPFVLLLGCYLAQTCPVFVYASDMCKIFLVG